MASELAKELHSVNFGEKNTWDDWKLIPIKRPVFAPPAHKYIAVDIPGSDGELDLSDVLTSYPVFSNRTGDLSFRLYETEETALKRYSEIMNYLHGQRMHAVLEEDLTHYYEGRYEVTNFVYHKYGEWADITIKYNVSPYKMDVVSSVEPWLWDDFDFENDIARDYSEIAVDGVKTVTVIGSRKPTVPKIITSAPMVLTYDGVNYNLPEGTSTVSALILEEEEYELTFTGTGTVSIEFRGGSL